MIIRFLAGMGPYPALLPWRHHFGHPGFTVSESPQHPDSYYAATATATGFPDHPALGGEEHCDVCVIGGGYTGLSSALHLAERGFDVILLEANRVGWGASGRNGGQLGSGQRQDQWDLERHFGEGTARELWQLGEAAKARVRELIQRHTIDCAYRPGILHVAHKARMAPALERYVGHLREYYSYDRIHWLPRERLREVLASDGYHGGWLDEGAGHLHPLNYALGLARAASAAGVRIFEHSRVSTFQGGRAPIACTHGGAVRARHLVVACNGYLGKLVPQLAGRIMPINNFIIATAPLGEAGAEALIHDHRAVTDTRFVINYYRMSADHRLLFGGGENYRRRFPADIRAFVRPYMLEVFPQLADTPIDYAWGGALAITRNRMPLFGRLAGEVYYALGFSGHGVAMGTLAGELIAEALTGTAGRFDLLANLRVPAFPGGTLLRWPALVLGMLYYGLRDRL